MSQVYCIATNGALVTYLPAMDRTPLTYLPELDGSRPREAGSRVGRVGVVAVAREGRGGDEGLPAGRRGVQDEAAADRGHGGQAGLLLGLVLRGRLVVAQDRFHI